MFYFELIAAVKKLPWKIDDEPNRARRRMKYGSHIAAASEHYSEQHKKESCIFVYALDEDKIGLDGIFQEKKEIQELFLQQLAYMQIEIEEPVLKEITFARMNRHLDQAGYSNYVNSSDEILEEFELVELNDRFLQFVEFILKTQSREEILQECCRHPLGEELIPEIDRIYNTKVPENVFGHPAHYLMQCDDQDVEERMVVSLLDGLYANGRLKTQRFTVMNVPEYAQIPSRPFDRLYKSLSGGAMVIDYGKVEIEEEELASSLRDGISTICQMIKKYRNQVLTILCIPRESSRIKELFYQYLDNQCMICFKENILSPERSRGYLEQMAKEKGLNADEELLSMVKEDQKYYFSDLNSICEVWFDKKLKNEVFFSYKEDPLIEAQVQKEKKEISCAYDELMSMIGLTKAKSVINKALDYAKAQKLFASKGMKEERFSMHMVFTGNPGTAKTTAARLFAQIMKENDILTKGTFLEVGRADLIGKYVGWTAQIIKEKFNKARGGVLFIDEAYSLVDGQKGYYGDEAINTIVQEMENHRKDVIVIFAGYPDKMEEFINRNPGLRSRIAFHVPFDEYNADELCQIADLMLKEKDLHLSETAKAKLIPVFEKASSQSDFGNGRYVRNLIEQARMAQASRLVHMNEDMVTQELLHTIEADDIEIPAFAPKLQVRTSRIGFKI